MGDRAEQLEAILTRLLADLDRWDEQADDSPQPYALARRIRIELESVRD